MRSIGYDITGTDDLPIRNALKMGIRLFKTNPDTLMQVGSTIRNSGIRDQICLCLTVSEVPSVPELNTLMEQSSINYLDVLIYEYSGQTSLPEILRKAHLRRCWHQMDMLKKNLPIRELGIAVSPTDGSDLIHELRSISANDSCSSPTFAYTQVTSKHPTDDISTYCFSHKINLFVSYLPDQDLTYVATLLRRGIGIFGQGKDLSDLLL